MFDTILAGSINEFYDKVEENQSLDYGDYGSEEIETPDTCDSLHANCVCFEIESSGVKAPFADMECRRRLGRAHAFLAHTFNNYFFLKIVIYWNFCVKNI